MSKLRNAIFYLGWVGNLVTCILALAISAIYTFWVLDYLWDGKYAKCFASLITVVYHALIGKITFKWLRSPKKEIAFIFIFYWIFSVFVWFLAILISLADFDFIGTH